MEKIDVILEILRKNELFNEFLVIDTLCRDNSIVISGHTNDGAVRIQITVENSGTIHIESTEGGYNYNGYVDSRLHTQDRVESIDKAISILELVIKDIDTISQPFTLRQTLDVLIDAGAHLISVEPNSLVTGIRVVPHVSDNINAYRQFVDQIRCAKARGRVFALEIEPTTSMSPSSTSIIAYADHSEEHEISFRNTKIGTEKVEEALSLRPRYSSQ